MGFFSKAWKGIKKSVGLSKPDLKIPEPPEPEAPDLVNPNLVADEELESEKERVAKAARGGKGSLKIPRKGTGGAGSNGGGASSATGTNI